MSFNPPLHSATLIAFTQASSTLYFTYDNTSLPSNATPEVYTNLLTPDWSAIPFLPSKAGIRTATLSLKDARSGHYEFTYRHTYSDGGIEWLGQAGSNGRIELIEEDGGDGKWTPKMVQDGEGVEVQDNGERTALLSFQLREGKSDEVQVFNLGVEASEWAEGTGVVWERSE